MLCQWRKNVIITVLVLTLMVLAGACTQDNPTNNPTAKPTPDQATVQPPQFDPEDGPLVKYKEPVVVNIAGINHAGMAFIEGESENDNLHTRTMKEYLNIEYKNFWFVDAAKHDEKINLAIVSDTLPDVMVVNITQLQSLIRNDQVEDMTDIYEYYVSDLTREMLEFQDKVSFIPATKEGRIYGIPAPSGGGYGEMVPVMFVRQDWLDNVALKSPENLDELFEVAKAFVEQDPDGNDKKDTYAFTLDKDLGQMTLNAIASAHKAYPGKWLKNASGELVYGSIQPEMKETLAYMNELYKIGTFDPEFATKDISKVFEMVVAGQIGIHFGVQSGAIVPFLQVKEANPEFDLSIKPIPAANDGTTIPGTTPFTTQWMVVKKGYSNPEAPLKSMNLIAEMLYNEDHPLWKWWTEVNTGDYQGLNANMYILPFQFADPRGWLEASEQLRYWRDTGDESKLGQGEKIVVEQWIKPGGSFGWAIEKTFYEAWKVIGDYKEFKYSDYVGAPTSTQISKGPSLDKLEKETIVNIIMGLAPLDEFDNFVESWHKLGGDEITAEINEEYQKLNK